MFVKHGCPRQQQSQNMAKISNSYILTPPHPLGHVMSVKCEEPIDEPTVQVWLIYHHPNFKYCTLFVRGTELRTDKQTDKPITRCPRQTFQAGGIKTTCILPIISRLLNCRLATFRGTPVILLGEAKSIMSSSRVIRASESGVGEAAEWRLTSLVSVRLVALEAVK